MSLKVDRIPRRGGESTNGSLGFHITPRRSVFHLLTDPKVPCVTPLKMSHLHFLRKMT